MTCPDCPILQSRVEKPPAENARPEDRPPPEEEGLAGEARGSMMEWAGKPYESDEVRRFAAKILNGIDHGFTFLDVAGVEATNNRVGRALREHVVQSRIMGTFRNGKGKGSTRR